MLPNQIYDVLKWMALIFLPALSLLLKGVGELYLWEGAARFVGLIQVFAVFLGTILQVSSHYYREGGNDHDDFSGFV